MSHADGLLSMWRVLLVVLLASPSSAPALTAAALPPELPLWKNAPPGPAGAPDVKERVRSHKAERDSPSKLNRVFSSVSTPTYSIHRPEKPNGTGVVICPGGGFRDIWIDREGHDLAIWLKSHGVTSLVLKYRTRPAVIRSKEVWQRYQRAVRADGWQAIRVLRQKASELGLKPERIGICGFSAGGHLAISCALHPEPKLTEGAVSGMPSFAGLFYPGIPDDVDQAMATHTGSKGTATDICPMFIVNARVDRLTPAEKCIGFYAKLLKVGVNAELHVFSKGSHGFGLGAGRGRSVAMWPTSFAAWLFDITLIRKQRPSREGEQ